MSTKLIAAAAATTILASAASAQVINEVRISSPGGSDDTSNFVEIAGTPGTDLSGLTLLAISAEFNPGLVNNAIPLSGSIPDDGFFLLSAGDNPDAADQIEVFDFFGSPTNFIITDSFTGAQDDDLDADDDGTVDDAGVFGSVIAALSLTDGNDDSVDVFYGGGAVVGPEGTFTPAHVFRDPDITGDFVIGEFGSFDADTPGAANSAPIPEPASLALLSVVGLGLMRRRTA